MTGLDAFPTDDAAPASPAAGEASSQPSLKTDKAANASPSKEKTVHDALSGLPLKRRDAVDIEGLRPALTDFIRQAHPALPTEGYVQRRTIEEFRSRYIASLLREERGELTTLENEVLESLESHDVLTENIVDDYEEGRSIGDRVADLVAKFGGSWTFIISFCAFLAVWMMINIVLGATGAFDAYPFILLNLVLSTVAALQAPVIMMSQRRQEQKDRLRALNDYKVNLKAELEIRHLHEKVDHLLNRQWERLTEIQQIQIEMMRDQSRKTEQALKAVRKPRSGSKKMLSLQLKAPAPSSALPAEEED
ncbi:DUF1003 domain-containing protein [Rhizobium sp. SAFR-030]|uniref:DUF1003 domain-containing protein n=1 Tax=Rhizobium sp. SAFR-030 TaxID=3387277 RepID=UPI003F80760F